MWISRVSASLAESEQSGEDRRQFMGVPGRPAMVRSPKSNERSTGVSMLHRIRVLTVLTLVLFALPAGAQTTNARVVALTVDDLPLAVPGDDQAPGNLAEVQRVNASILKILAAHRATAIGFVNEIKLNVDHERDARVRILCQWLEAGMALGNHTYSHPALSKVGESQYEDDFVRGTTITMSEMKAVGKTEKYFRYPYLDTGKDKAEKQDFIAFFTSRGFINAPVTVQNEDWLFNVPYSDATAKQNSSMQKRVVESYLQHTSDVLAYAEESSKQCFGREIPQVMLLHDDALNADHLDAVLSAFEQRGYHFINLEEALRDPAYATADDYVGSDGLTWLERWQIALGKPFHPEGPKPPKWAQDEYRRITGNEP
jgi:peptidoglycan/xylan/chitin deacetylase (PgdA/CDA1 family)